MKLRREAGVLTLSSYPFVQLGGEFGLELVCLQEVDVDVEATACAVLDG